MNPEPIIIAGPPRGFIIGTLIVTGLLTTLTICLANFAH
jgi:hypothetical protein